MPQEKVSDHKVSCITSCVRHQTLEDILKYPVGPINDLPQPGDLVLVECVVPQGAYNFLEGNSGEKVQLLQGQINIMVLGNRFSGTNVFGHIPKTCLYPDTILYQLSASGILGIEEYTPSWASGKTSSHKVLGFPIGLDGEILNLQKLVPAFLHASNIEQSPSQCIFVGGTSAEVGKSTFTSRLIEEFKKQFPTILVSAIKATGTGRTKDLKTYLLAGADSVSDYVDMGHPSTYGLDSSVFNLTLNNLIAIESRKSDIVIIELGGDLLEANCPEALQVARKNNSTFCLLVNDAMGASCGLQILKDNGLEASFISSFRQNLWALSQRLNISFEKMIDMDSPQNMSTIVKNVINTNLKSQEKSFPFPSPTL